MAPKQILSAKAIPVVVAVVTLLVGSGIVWKVIDAYNANRPPRFRVSAINSLTGNNVYEITNHLIGVGPSSLYTMTWGLEVIPQYTGKEQYGEIRVLVKGGRGNVVGQAKWDNFSSEAKTLFVALDPAKLTSDVAPISFYGGFQTNIFETDTFTAPEAVFDIEITPAKSPQSPLQKEKLIIRNAPWYHYTAMSAWHGSSIDVFVHGKNLGEQSDFAVVSNIFEITKVPGTPWDVWPWVDYRDTLVMNVSAGQEFTATLTFPASDRFKFEAGKAYCVETYLVKKQNYIQFDDGAWQDSGRKWMLGSFSTWHLVVK